MKCEQRGENLAEIEQDKQYTGYLQKYQDECWRKFKWWKGSLVSFLIVSLIFFVVGTGCSYRALFLQNKVVDCKITQKLCVAKSKSEICC